MAMHACKTISCLAEGFKLAATAFYNPLPPPAATAPPADAAPPAAAACAVFPVAEVVPDGIDNWVHMLHLYKGTFHLRKGLKLAANAYDNPPPPAPPAAVLVVAGVPR